MVETASCPRCGIESAPDESPYGLCAGCVLDIALAEPPTFHDERQSPPIDTSLSITEIAGFRIMDILGAGGSGVVYLAEQPPPIPRVVALKVLGGAVGRDALARFDEERRALARLEHPGIARIYDTGITNDGRPFLAMEYVDGSPITTYCETNQLGLDARLGLVVSVCETIEAAHRKGVIHRDLKPSNVLVRDTDSGPAPIVIDFGLAKFASGGSQKDLSLPGQVLGTPHYMSPEQARGDHDSVDTRTDVHAMGAVLHELLVGLPPYARGDATDDDLLSVLRRVGEEKAVAPSDRAAEDLTLELPGSGRKAFLQDVVTECRRDLDCVVAKALAKDADQRYASPSELAADITRHRRHETVVARPPTAVYRLKQFVRRHRFGVAAAAIVLVALLAGVVGTTVGLIRAVRAERVATAAQTLADERAQREAREARTAQQVSDFLVGLFKVSDPDEARGSSITAREVLDRGAEKIRRELGGEPRVRARLMDTMGRVYRNLGVFKAATPLLEEALRTREELSPPDGLEVAQSLDSVGILHREMGRTNEAKPLFERSLEIRERTLGPDHVDVASSLNNLASVCYDQGDLQEAKRLHERALSIRAKTLPPDDLDLAISRMNLALVVSDLGERDRATSLLEQARGIFEARGPDSLDLALALDALGVIHAEADELDAAAPLIEKALRLRERVLGPDHPDVAASLINFGNVNLAASRLGAARPHFERAIRILERARVPDHRTAAFARGSLSALLVAIGQFDEARREFRRAIAILTKLGGPVNSDAADVLKEYSHALRTAGRSKEADEIATREAGMRRLLAAETPAGADR